MYNHRILSFLAFTGTFWSVSMTSSFLAWLALSTYFSSSSDEQGRVKQEVDSTDGQANGAIKTEEDDDESFDAFSTEDLSDTQRTFPTLGRQMPLRFPGRASEGVKREETEEEKMERTVGIQPLIGEADDEDEYVERRGGRTDSGLGTSLDEEAGRRDGVQKRRNRLFGGGGR
jgi:seipin